MTLFIRDICFNISSFLMFKDLCAFRQVNTKAGESVNAYWEIFCRNAGLYWGNKGLLETPFEFIKANLVFIRAKEQLSCLESESFKKSVTGAAFISSCLIPAGERGHEGWLKAVLERAEDKCISPYHLGNVLVAAIQGRHLSMVNLLIEKASEERLAFALQEAVIKGDVPIIRTLIESACVQGILPNVIDSMLIKCVAYKQRQVLQILLSNPYGDKISISMLEATLINLVIKGDDMSIKLIIEAGKFEKITSLSRLFCLAFQKKQFLVLQTLIDQGFFEKISDHKLKKDLITCRELRFSDTERKANDLTKSKYCPKCVLL